MYSPNYEHFSNVCICRPLNSLVIIYACHILYMPFDLYATHEHVLLKVEIKIPYVIQESTQEIQGGWSDVLKVSCILRHRGVQLTLAYSWARPTILLAGKGRGDIFISSGSLLSFLFLFLPCPSYSSHPLSLLSLFSLPLGDDTKWPTRFGVSLNPQSNQSKSGNPNVVSVFKNGRKSTKFIHST